MQTTADNIIVIPLPIAVIGIIVDDGKISLECNNTLRKRKSRERAGERKS